VFLKKLTRLFQIVLLSGMLLSHIESTQVLMRNIESDILMIALKGADDMVKDKFLSNMSSRAADMFLDDMEAKGPMRIKEVEEAQKDILKTARRLSDSGEMMLPGRGDGVVG